MPGNALPFPPSGDRGAPRSTTGGGTRGTSPTSCLLSEAKPETLVSLMPNRENSSKTATATPSFYWYIPETKATKAEFYVADAQNQEIYFTTLSLASGGGIIRLYLPAQTAFKPGQTYTWSLNLICDPNRRSADKYVGGKIQYIQLNTEQKKLLSNAKGLEKAKLSVQANLWPETLEEIAQLRKQYPQEWQELLQSVGLELLVNKPFLECCESQ
jgi:hypothetical protein